VYLFHRKIVKINVKTQAFGPLLVRR